MLIIERYLLENTLPVPENWSMHAIGTTTARTKESANKHTWIFYVGGNDWEPNFKYQAVFAQKNFDKQGEQSRIWIEVKYPVNIKSDDETKHDEFTKEQTEFGEMVANLWLKIAKRLRADHVKEYTAYDKALTSENDKMHKIEKQGGKYERKLPPSAKYKGNWADAFAMALKTPELNKHIKQRGIDRVDWIESKTDIKDYELE